MDYNNFSASGSVHQSRKTTKFHLNAGSRLSYRSFSISLGKTSASASFAYEMNQFLHVAPQQHTHDENGNSPAVTAAAAHICSSSTTDA